MKSFKAEWKNSLTTRQGDVPVCVSVKPALELASGTKSGGPGYGPS